MNRHRIRPTRVTRRLAIAGVSMSIAVAGTALLLGGGLASADAASTGVRVQSPLPAASTTVTADGNAMTLSVEDAEDLPAVGAHLTVSGSGFDTADDLWIAVCQADGAAPAALIHCLGGPIPDENATAGWGVVNASGRAEQPGPVAAKWGHGGSFTLTLQVPVAKDRFADCLSASCAVYARTSDDTDVVDGLEVPVSFAGVEEQTTTTQPTTTQPPTTQPPTTQTFGGVATTVSPEMMQSTALVAGGEQTVLFAGFTPGEDVDVTLYSDPITLPAARADGSGNVRITFTVPDDLPAGEHLVEAVGRQSNRVGIASFTVSAPTTTASTTDTSASTTESSASTEVTGDTSTPATTAPATSAGAVAATTTVATATSPATPSTAATPVGDDSGGTRLLWLWIVLVVLVLAAGAAGVIVMLRARRARDDGPPPTDDEAAPPRPGWGPPGPAGPAGSGGAGGAPADEIEDPRGFGLLLGQEPTDADARPTVIAGPGAPTEHTVPVHDPVHDPEPGTEQWTPDFTDDDPSTERDNPDGRDVPPPGRHSAE